MHSQSFKKAIAIICFLFSIHFISYAQVNFPLNSQFKYLKGSEAAVLASDWYSEGFDDSGWISGFAPFWYDNGAGGTELTDMANNYSTVYLRASFNVKDAALISLIKMNIDYDDGFIVWINGKVAVSQFAPVFPTYEAFATDNHESGIAEQFEVFTNDINLKEGSNLIAVQGFNVSLTSSDFHFNISLYAETETPVFPDSIPVSFSHQSGFYKSPFNLQITPASDSLDVFYTLDGSHPGYSPTAVKLAGGGTVSINPESSAGGGVTPAVVVRTSIVEAGFEPSYPQSRTFIFPDAVKTQSHPGGIWPKENINDQWLDFAMDTDITLGVKYGSKIEGALKAIPTISIITDIDNLFGESEGIYVNAFGHGSEWERECSVELIYPDSIGFQTNAGLRIRGGWSRHSDFPKHSFRLFFRSMYGDGKLDYPLFGDEGASEYDKIDLRTSQNYAWAQGDSRNTMVREVFSRDLQRDMGQPYTRSRYYHVYLNGMYWGLYQTQERSEAKFASSYFGDDPEDYDVVKVNTEDWSYRIEATDGNLNLWQEIYNLTKTGFEDNKNYYKLEGKDSNGKISRTLYKLVDIDNLIDYMIGIFYTGNFDSPTSSFMQNKGCNNFFAINERDNPTTGFIFFNHDAEHSLFVDPASPGIGIEEDRVNIGDPDDPMQMTVTSFEQFHPQWLHYKLTENEDYRIRFNDRAYKYLKPGGLLTDDVCLKRFNTRAAQIDQAIIAESGRWGDAKRSPSYNRDDWVRELNSVRKYFFEERPPILIDQLILGGLYSIVVPPEIELDSWYIDDDIISISESTEISVLNPQSTGKIYYTINGHDPRLPGGAVNWKALTSDSKAKFEINSTTVVRARVLANGTWSALRELYVNDTEEDYSKLKITEIHYNPLDSIVGTDTISGQDYEFIEFKNIGTAAINLSGLVIDSAVHYKFPDNKFLLPREFFVVAAKPVKFFERYGKIASGNYTDNLSNAGELILLKNSKDEIILQFRYDDQFPWPVHADGVGNSLVPVMASPENYPGSADYWVKSAMIGGSPFANDGNSDMTTVPEVIANTMIVYPNPATDIITVEIPAMEDSFADIRIDIYDLNGKQIYQIVGSSGSTINLREAGIYPGVYILDVTAQGIRERTKLVYLGE